MSFYQKVIRNIYIYIYVWVLPAALARFVCVPKTPLVIAQRASSDQTSIFIDFGQRLIFLFSSIVVGTYYYPHARMAWQAIQKWYMGFLFLRLRSSINASSTRPMSPWSVWSQIDVFYTDKNNLSSSIFYPIWCIYLLLSLGAGFIK